MAMQALTEPRSVQAVREPGSKCASDMAAVQCMAASFVETIHTGSLTMDPDEFLAHMVAAGVPDMAMPPLIWFIITLEQAAVQSVAASFVETIHTGIP